jgi:HEAT repeat protein
MKPSREHQFRIVVLCAAALAAAACDQPQKKSRWSTRDDSVVASGASLSTPILPKFQVLDEQLPSSAQALLIEASLSEDPQLRSNAIEGLHPVPEQLGEPVRRGLADENKGVRFAATMTVGLKQLCSLSHLVQPLLDDPDPSVRAAALFSLHQCGVVVDLNPLAGMVLGSDSTVKGNAAYILGEIGNPQAIPLIKNGVGRHEGSFDVARGQAIDLVMAEAMVKLGDDQERQVIQAALFAPPERGELTALACQMIARMQDGTLNVNLESLASASGPRKPGPEIRLLAAFALAQTEPGRVPMEFVMASISSKNPLIRSHAANVLGSMGSPRYAPQLSMLLRDENPRVQVSAAAAILRLNESSVARQGDGVY